VIAKPLSPSDSALNRDAVCKALYTGLFAYIVAQINNQLFPPHARSDELKWIGILDVFGFESFEHNSFEQFCINFCNERLQQYFNRYILKSEQDEYRAEAIMWTPIRVPDNQDVIDLIERRANPPGLLSLLDAACKMPKGDDKGFTANVFQIHSSHARIKQVTRIKVAGQKGILPINGFSIHHYAGQVTYNAKEFLSKNSDATQSDNQALFATSKSSVTRQLLTEAAEAKAPAPGKSSSSSFQSTGSVFSSQLQSLMALLYQTTPYFVRCVKPNRLKKPQQFDWEYVRPQLECGGIVEALRILKCGYPTRCTYQAIFERYGSILHPTPPDLNLRDFCEAVLRNAGATLERSEFQLGLSKVFFRPGKQDFLESLLEEGGELPAETVRAIRRFMLNKRLQRARAAIRYVGPWLALPCFHLSPFSFPVSVLILSCPVLSCPVLSHV